ncbi:MAG: ATP-binding cassette domain-containing protein [Novosphingobium sp.]
MLDLAGRRRAGGLFALMIAAALTEGLGLLMLVPLLAVLVPGNANGSKLATVFVGAGVPLALGPLLTLFVGLVALRALVMRARTLTAVRAQVALVDELRMRAWNALLNCEWRHLLTLSRGHSASLLLSEVERAGLGVQQLLLAAASAVTLGGVLLGALLLSPLMTLGALGAGALLIVLQAGLRRTAHRLGEEVGEAHAALHASLDEGLASLRTIKSLEGEAAAAAQSALSIRALRSVQLEFARRHTLNQGLLQVGGAVALALLVWLAVRAWGLGAATILPMVAVFARALPLLGQVQDAWLNWLHARPALDAALRLTVQAEAAREPEPDQTAAPSLTQAVRLERVGLQFIAGEAVLHDVTLEMPARGMTALTGPSGAGKSTLADLIAGLLSPDRGQVTIDGVPLSGPQRRAWRRQVAYVQQDPVLIAGTLRDNLVWGAPQASDEALRDALHRASADFALALPEGLDTRIGDGGRGLSGGERQRLMLARALLRKPALLILDEATSALDPVNEAQIAAALERLKAQIAVLVIAHRGALTSIADRTYELSAGRLVNG